MIKKHLLAPGPTPVSEPARLAMAASLIHHRGAEFKEVFGSVRERLAWAHQTSGEVVALTCSGTGGFEAALTAFTRRGDTIICVGGGKFGERWSEMAVALGLRVIQIDVSWGDAVDLDVVAATLEAHPDATAFTMSASETSTGVMHDVEGVAKLLADHPGIFICDGITAVGVHPLPMDDWGVDVMVSGSQKAFSVPPGMAFVAVQDHVWERAERSDHPRYYLDLVKERDGQRKNSTAFTPAISIALALDVALGLMQDEGLDGIWARHQLLGDATRAGVQALGLELLASRPGNATTATLTPDGIDAPALVRRMNEGYGVTIAGGQGDLKPRLFRIGHIGYFDRSDILIALGALEGALQDLGADIEPGAAVTAAQRVFLNAGRTT